MKKLLLMLLLVFVGCQDKTWVNCHGSYMPNSEAIKVRRDSIKSVIQEGGRYCVSIEHAEGGQAYVVVDKEDEWKVK